MKALARVLLFVGERFPLVPSVLAATLMALSAALLGAGVLHRDTHIDARSAVLVAVVVALLFVVRVVDDVRDLGHDRQHHPARPLPRGAVGTRDVVVAAIVVCLATLAAVAVVCGGAAAAAVAVVVAFTVVLQLDAGVRAVADRPLLTLLVHQPMVAVWAALVACVSTSSAPDGNTLTALGPVCALAVALSLLFELGRDVRGHADSPHTDSYVALWGPGWTATALVCTAVVAAAIVAWLAVLLRLAWWSVTLPVMSLAVVAGASVWFACSPRPRSARAVVVSSAAASLWVHGPLLLGALHA